jgi:hypothetical protein
MQAAVLGLIASNRSAVVGARNRQQSYLPQELASPDSTKAANVERRVDWKKS